VSTEFAANARHGAPPSAPLLNAQTATEVAAVMVDLIDHPRAEAYTNPAGQIERVKQYYADVAAFEENLGR